jgi:hypothetical protein
MSIKEFEPLKAVEHWNKSSLRARRPDFKDKLKSFRDRNANEVEFVGEEEIQGIEDDNVSVRDVIEDEGQSDEGQSDEAIVNENVSDEEEVVFEKLLNIEREMEYV